MRVLVLLAALLFWGPGTSGRVRAEDVPATPDAAAAPAGDRAETVAPSAAEDDPIPPKLDSMYVHGLRYLASTQGPEGCWAEDGYGSQAGVVGLAIMAVRKSSLQLSTSSSKLTASNTCLRLNCSLANSSALLWPLLIKSANA